MQTRPRIAIFIDSLDPGGAESVVARTARDLVARGYRVEVFHLGNQWLSSELTRIGIQHTELGFAMCHRHWALLPAFVLGLAFLLRRRKIDVLHSHLYGAFESALFACVLARVRHVATLHDAYSLEIYPRSALMVRGALTMGSRVVCVSSDIKQRLVSRGASQESLTVIHNGVEEDFVPEIPRVDFRSSLRCPTNALVVSCIARLDPIKRHDRLLDVAARLRDEAVLFWIVGDGPERDSIVNRIENARIDNVEMLGMRSDIPDVLAASDLLVLLSDSEGCSCTIQEALFSGVPVLATDVGGNAELIVSGLNGLLVPQEQAVEEVVRMIKEFISDTARLLLLAAGALKSKDRMSIARTVDDYERLYADHRLQ